MLFTDSIRNFLFKCRCSIRFWTTLRVQYETFWDWTKKNIGTNEFQSELNSLAILKVQSDLKYECALHPLTTPDHLKSITSTQ